MPKHGRILIVDDDRAVLEALHERFHTDYDTILASSAPQAMDILGGDPDIDLVVMDIKMPKVDGLRTTELIKEHDPQLPVIVLTGYPGEYSEREIDEQHRPFDYVRKSDGPERLVRSVRNGVRMRRLLLSSDDLVAIARDEYRMVGRSDAIRKVYTLIERLAPTRTKVLITGPTGSGKGLIARAIHTRSQRAGNRFVPYNCSNSTPSMADREFFGHIKGAFTDAHADRPGLFEFAEGGTVFLDEISNLGSDIQGKLLQVLDDGEVSRIGSPETFRVDFRLICATNRNLEAMVADGRFREDLYYRIRGAVIEVPPLASRRTDIPELAVHFLERHCRERGIVPKIFTHDALDLLADHPWPGNVRDLRHEVEKLADLTLSSLITREDILDNIAGAAASTTTGLGTSLSSGLREYERNKILRALSRTGGNVTGAARMLQEDPANLRRRMRRLGLASGQKDRPARRQNRSI